MFKLNTNKTPKGDQPNAINKTLDLLKDNNELIIHGSTGTGKTFTVANIIKEKNIPALVLAPNKTLANQLYAELKELFPENRVEFFTSAFDYYRPEAYSASTDTYIEKQSVTSWAIEQSRMSTLNSLSTREDVIVVSSVASIYGLGDPKTFKDRFYFVEVGKEVNRDKMISSLVRMGYERTNIHPKPGEFRAKGDHIEVMPSWASEYFIKIDMFGDEIEEIQQVNSMNRNIEKNFKEFLFAPASEYGGYSESSNNIADQIEKDLEERLKYFKENNLQIEYQRLENRVRMDIDQFRSNLSVSGIENYSKYIDGRSTGEAPNTLMDYFPNEFLTIVDESHISIPQITGMYEGDKARKETLVNHGFRLPSALDNRPLKFDEWYKKLDKTIYLSATPGNFELGKDLPVVEMINRPTGLLDPEIEIRTNEYQLDDIINEIYKRKEKNERVIINTMTKKMSEDISQFLSEKGIKTAYIHSDLKPIERFEVIRKLRLGDYDVLVGINLLREGIDIPEVSLITILDGDKEGFMRNKNSLIQLIGRAARNENGKAIIYAQTITESIKEAVFETEKRRSVQINFNKENNIKPKTIFKEIPEKLVDDAIIEKAINYKLSKKQIEDLTKEMEDAARNMNFERAIELRDLIAQSNNK